MATRLTLLAITDLRGGRNGVDSPLELQPDQCVEAVNVDWYQGLIGRKRRGCVAVSLAGSGIVAGVTWLFRHLPTAVETDNELWAVDAWGAHFARLVAGLWQPVTAIDSMSGQIRGVSFNGKLFLAGGVTVDRLHVWDGTSIRRVGLAIPAAPTVTAAAGIGSTGQRWYRIAWVVMVGGVVTRRSDLSPAGTLALSNQGGWIVTRPVAPGEGETHWELYAGAAAAGPWYLSGPLPIAVPSSTDNTPAPIPDPAWIGTLAAPAVAYTAPPAAKYLLVDEARLLLAGSWRDPTFGSRVWWTPILNDASGVGNDERIAMDLNPFIDFDPGDGGEITGLGGPLFDSPYVFKFDRIYKMVRTGLSSAPYRPVTVSKKCGALRQETIVQGEDESGNECIYFLSRRGPYRLGVNGLQYCGRDIEDLWATVYLIDAAPGEVAVPGAHGLYHADLHQVWWWVNTHPGAPDLKLVFDVKQGRFVHTEGVRRGWSQHTGPSAQAYSSAMYSETIGSHNSLALKPYIGRETASLFCADVLPMTDAGTPYQAYIRSRVELPGGSIAEHGGVIEGHLLAWPTNATLRFDTERDFGIENRTASIVLPSSTVERVIVPIRDLGAASVSALQIWMGDPTAIESAWTLDQLVLRVRREEDR